MITTIHNIFIIYIKVYIYEGVKGYGYSIYRRFQQYFSYIVVVSFIGGGNRSTQRNPSTCRKSLINVIT